VARVSFVLRGIEPKNDPTYRTNAKARRWFWREAAIVGLKIKRNSLIKGLGASGNPLAPIHALTRQARKDDVNPVTGNAPYSPMGKARPNAPPLLASGRRSRTYSLLDAQARGESVQFSWRNDPHTGHNWGDILARHAKGFSRHFVYPARGWGYVKPRNVIGLSTADRQAIAAEMAKRWNAYTATIGQPKAKPDRVYEKGMVNATDFDTGEDRMMRGNRLFYFTGGFDGFKNLPPSSRTPPRPTPPTPPRSPASAVALLPPTPTIDLPPQWNWDTPLPQYVIETLPDPLKHVRTVRELMRSRGGRLWWRAVGRTIAETKGAA
jgi:hypothetical protein